MPFSRSAGRPSTQPSAPDSSAAQGSEMKNGTPRACISASV